MHEEHKEGALLPEHTRASDSDLSTLFDQALSEASLQRAMSTPNIRSLPM